MKEAEATRRSRTPAGVDVGAILNYLGMPAERPGLDYLRRLLLAYRDRVPYETVTRLLGHRDGPAESSRPPARFWEETIANATGGSCSESTYAFKKLLDALGFECAMAVGSTRSPDHDAARETSCPADSVHCCVIVELDGGRYAADPCCWHYIKIPLPLGGRDRVDLRGRTDAIVPYHYAVEPLADGFCGIHNLGPDGRPDPEDPTRGLVYVLRDRALTDQEFEEHALRENRCDPSSDHLSFVRRDPRTKIESRYDSRSGRLERKVWGTWEEADLGDDAAPTLARASGLPQARIEEALGYLGLMASAAEAG